MTKGTYTLVLSVPTSTIITVGALGERTFPAGWYAYTGSAFGPGGFSRVDRHRELAAGERDTRHWHIDYLLGSPDVTLETVFRSPGVDRECAIAQTLPGEPIAAFGASDCRCDSHLTRVESRDILIDALADIHDNRE